VGMIEFALLYWFLIGMIGSYYYLKPVQKRVRK